MESSFDLSKYDWFHSMDSETVYVKYMNTDIFNIVPMRMKIHFAQYKNLTEETFLREIEDSEEE